MKTVLLVQQKCLRHAFSCSRRVLREAVHLALFARPDATGTLEPILEGNRTSPHKIRLDVIPGRRTQTRGRQEMLPFHCKYIPRSSVASLWISFRRSSFVNGMFVRTEKLKSVPIYSIHESSRFTKLSRSSSLVKAPCKNARRFSGCSICIACASTRMSGASLIFKTKRSTVGFGVLKIFVIVPRLLCQKYATLRLEFNDRGTPVRLNDIQSHPLRLYG